MDNLTPITREEILMNDEPLTPITREEKILAGEDLTPVTRREYFLKKYRHAGGDVMVEGLSVTENGTYTAPEGKAYSPVNVNVPMPENAYLLKTASGSLVSFSDGADLPIPSFVCNIDAQQDLHGYDHPWVGGAGKNKFYMESKTATYAGVTYVYDASTNTLTKSGTSTGSAGVNIAEIDVPEGTYTFSANFNQETGEKTAIFIRRKSDDTNVGNISKSTTTVTLTLSGTYYIRLSTAQGETGGIISEIQLEQGETATAYAPYENICSISGHTEANVSVSGVNIWDEEWEVGAIIAKGNYPSTTNIRSKNYMNCVGGVTYFNKCSAQIVVFQYDENKTLIKPSASTYILVNSNSTFTMLTNTRYMRFYTQPSYGTTYNHDISINYPSTDTEYHAYNPNSQTIQVSWQTEAGEVYGGEIDLVSGVLTVTDGYIASYDGEILPSTWISDSDVYAEGTTPTTGAEVVYKLAEAQTYQLTPTQIKSLLGTNNAWCDTGDVDIDYFAKEV